MVSNNKGLLNINSNRPAPKNLFSPDNLLSHLKSERRHSVVDNKFSRWGNPQMEEHRAATRMRHTRQPV